MRSNRKQPEAELEDEQPIEAQVQAVADMAAAAVQCAVQRQRHRGRVRRDTGMAAGGMISAFESSADVERPDPPSAEKAVSYQTQSLRRRFGALFSG